MKQHQAGFTLVELMISLVLGLSLIAGISELFLQSQKTYRAQRSLSYMMGDGRYVLEILSKELRHTGFLRERNAANGLATKIFLADTAALGTSMMPTNMPIIDLNPTEAIHGVSGGGGSDAFVFRYQLSNATDLSSTDPSNSSSPCSLDINLELGEDPAREPHVVTTYFFVDQQGQLSCEAKRETIDLTNRLTVCMKPTSGCATPTAQPIISNVERLVVKYGVDFDINANGTPHVQSTTDAVGNLVPILDGDGNPAPCLDGSANYYVDADNVSDWTRVVSAQLYVVLRSEDDNLTQAPATYRIDDTTYTATDKRYYRVFSTTVAFRNQLNNQPEEDRLLCL